MGKCKNTLLAAGLIFIGFQLVGCIPATQTKKTEMTEEERMLQQQVMEAYLARLKNAPANVPAPAPLSDSNATQPAPSVDESEVAKQIENIPVLPVGVEFERKRDGFDVNGVRYVDPEGEISVYGYNSLSGDFTYLARQAQNRYVVKYSRALTGAEPITIGFAERGRNSWNFTSVTGKRLQGDKLIPLSRGVLMGRSSTGFVYVPGDGVSSFAVPDGYNLAPLQSGEVYETRFVLLEKEPLDQRDTVGNMFSALSSLGSTVGIGKKEDYALYNLDTRKVVPFNIAMDNKDVQLHSQCRQVNMIINRCEQLYTYESLFKPDGRPNYGHYFWRVHWFGTQNGPVAVVQENGLRDVTITDLIAGKKVTAFSRALGINGMSANRRINGNIRVEAMFGFERQVLDDAVAFLVETPES